MRIRLDIPQKLSAIARELGGALIGEDATVTHLVTDSREARSGDLFIALRGERLSGADFCSCAERFGAYCLSDRGITRGILTYPLDTVPDRLAEYYLSLLEGVFARIAITGSVGKTTTKNILAAILSEKYDTHATEGNLNNTLGVPLSILKAPRNTEALVLECGMNQTGELSRISSLIKPTGVIITGIGTSHIGRLGSRENIARAKLELLSARAEDSFVIIPDGEPLLSKIEGALTLSTSESESADFSIIREGTEGGLSGEFFVRGRHAFDFSTELSGEHNLLSLGLAFSAATVLGVGFDKLAQTSGRLPANLLRARVYDAPPFTLIDDSYNASAEAVEAALDQLALLPRPRIAALGDMLELGEYSASLHQRVGRYAKDSGVDRLLLIGSHAEDYARGARECGMSEDNIEIYPSISCPTELSLRIAALASGGSVLVKGSHSTGLYAIAEELIKIHKTKS